MEDEKEQDYFFTFGGGQAYPNHYIVFHGTYVTAREQMMSRFGRKWSMQYSSKEDAGVDRWGLKELK